MNTYLDTDCTMQAILPTDNKQAFIGMFLTQDEYRNANMNLFAGKIFRSGYAYEINVENNPHGLSAVKITFMADQSLADSMLSPYNDFVLEDVCKKLKVKRLVAYGRNENDGFEETMQYDNKGKFVYESRKLYPDPFCDCYLPDDEKISDNSGCM